MYQKVTHKIDDIWSKWEMLLVYIGGIAMLAAMLITTADVLMRNILNKSILGAPELVSLLLMPIFVCALPYIQRLHGHVILEFATEKAPEKLKEIFNIFGMAVGAFLFCSIASKIVTAAIDSYTRLDKTMGAVSYYIWPAKFILAIVVLSMIVRLVLDILLTIGKLATPKAPEGKQ